MDAADRSPEEQFWLAWGNPGLLNELLRHDPLGVRGTEQAREVYREYLPPLRAALEAGEVIGLGPLITKLHDERGLARDEIRDHTIGISIAGWYETCGGRP